MRPATCVLVFLLLLTVAQQPPAEPTVRIGLNQNAATVTIRSASAFAVEGRTTRSATFASVLALDPAATGAVKKSDLQYRITAELDGGVLLVMAAGAHVRIDPPASPLEIENRAYRGTLDVFGNSRHTLTIVNELPLEDYLRGVVPNELSPTAFGQIEALKAQAVAARTYIERNLGQYKNEGYDICATDVCQVYFGSLTEDPLATQAVVETRGIVATYDGKPINALYSSTCGGRTEDAEKIFNEKIPYLVSTSCEYKHPPPQPFASSRAIPNWKEGVLGVARDDLRRCGALHGVA
jgi:peptidoglycan hydrolase-like amidase